MNGCKTAILYAAKLYAQNYRHQEAILNSESDRKSIGIVERDQIKNIFGITCILIKLIYPLPTMKEWKELNNIFYPLYVDRSCVTCPFEGHFAY